MTTIYLVTGNDMHSFPLKVDLSVPVNFYPTEAKEKLQYLFDTITKVDSGVVLMCTDNAVIYKGIFEFSSKYEVPLRMYKHHNGTLIELSKEEEFFTDYLKGVNDMEIIPLEE